MSYRGQLIYDSDKVKRKVTILRENASRLHAIVLKRYLQHCF